MSELFIDNTQGLKIPVAKLEFISDKEQVILGNTERDLILRTAGNIKIQIGNKFYDLPFVASDNSTSITIGGVTILELDSDLGILDYPGNGSLIYITSTKSFYVAVDDKYVLINKVDSSNLPNEKIYLSFEKTQSLDGQQKSKVLLNAGYIINSIDDISQFIDLDKTYAGQIIYSINDHTHYRLEDSSQPSLKESWVKPYITTESGGISKGGITITNNTIGIQDALFHLIGGINTKTLDKQSTFNNAFIQSETDFSKGWASWYDDLGDVYLESLSELSTKGFNFIVNKKPVLTLTEQGSSIYGTPNFNYGLTVNNDVLFTDNVYNDASYKSTDFVSGTTDGIGYSLAKDGSNLWTLEVDRLIVREDESVTINDVVYETKSINGSYWSPTEIKVTNVNLIETLYAYAKPAGLGSYRADHSLIPLSDKLSYASIQYKVEGTGDDEDTFVFTNTELLYGIGDRNSAGVEYSGPTTYVLDDEGNYHTIPATHYFDLTENEWIESDTIATHVLTRTLYKYQIETTAGERLDIGDLFIYLKWNNDEYIDRAVLAHVTAVTDNIVEITCYNGEINPGDRLICVGNTTVDKSSFQINGIDPNSDFIEVYDNIESFRAMFENIHLTSVNIDGKVADRNFVFKAESRVTIGNLFGKVNSDLGLNGSLQQGLYSDNAYIKGNLVANRLMLGGNLIWDGTSITLPGYVPNSRQLTINGTTYDLSSDRSWTIPVTSGTVTSVNMSTPTGFSISGNPITTSGTLALTFAAGYSLPTNASQTNWDTAYNRSAVSLSESGGVLTYTKQDTTSFSVNLNGRWILISDRSDNPSLGTSTTLVPTQNAVKTYVDANITSPVSLGTPNGLSLSGQVLSLGLSSTSTNGALSSTDWNTFNNKLSSFTETDPTVPTYSKSLTAFSVIKTDTDGLYEPIFSKNTAFNKNFGTSAGTVTEGNDSRVNNGQTAYGWGNHASVGYAIGGFGMYTPTMFALTGPTSYTITGNLSSYVKIVPGWIVYGSVSYIIDTAGSYYFHIPLPPGSGPVTVSEFQLNGVGQATDINITNIYIKADIITYGDAELHFTATSLPGTLNGVIYYSFMYRD